MFYEIYHNFQHPLNNALNGVATASSSHVRRTRAAVIAHMV